MVAVNKAQQLLQGLQAVGDECQQLTSVIEVCQLLVMGNEDTLAGFPVKQVVPALIALLQMDSNFDMMHHACRALTYMMEALPRSSAVVVDAVPVFLEKLQSIQCMDVAEQALSALEMLSRRHSKAILRAANGGIAASLMFLDFFSMPAQRSALTVTANCCQTIQSTEFHYIRDSLPLLSGKINQQDKKSVESVCLCFVRLVDNFQTDQRLLKEIAAHGLLTNIQQLLVVTPQVISSGTFVMVIHMLVIMCANCPDLAVVLLKQKIADTLCYLLVGTSEEQDSQSIDLLARSPQEYYEIVSLIGELMPCLPSDGIFSVNGLLRRGQSHNVSSVSNGHSNDGSTTIDGAIWQWKDDNGVWQCYSPIDSCIIEASHQANEDEVSLSTLGRSYMVDFITMQQINEDSGTSRPIQRKTVPPQSLPSSTSTNSSVLSSSATSLVHSDSRAEVLKENTELASVYIKTLFGVLYEVYSSSAGPSVRHKCLQALLRMLYYASPPLLEDVLRNHAVSSHIAAMMASQDLKVVVASIQMAYTLMEKLPDIFGVYFRREGVKHQIEQLCETEVLETKSKTPSQSPASRPTPSPRGSGGAVVSTASISLTVGNVATSEADHSLLASGSSASTVNSSPEKSLLLSVPPPPISTLPTSVLDLPLPSEPLCSTPPPQIMSQIASRRLSDVLKRKKPSKHSAIRKGSRGEESQEALPSRAGSTSGLLSRSTPMTRGKTLASKESKSSSGATKSSFLASLHPSRWGRSVNLPSPHRPPPPPKVQLHYNFQDSVISKFSPNNNVSSQKETVRFWVREKAQLFSERYFSEKQGNNHPALSVLNRLCQATNKMFIPNSEVSALKDISDILKSSDVSPFEIIHSGLVGKLLQYLTNTQPPPPPSPSSLLTSNTTPVTSQPIQAETIQSDSIRDSRLCLFLHTFFNCPLSEKSVVSELPRGSPLPASHLLSKLMGCFHHLEQFQVKVHDLPGGATASGHGSNTLKFFHTHQLKCHLQRHPDCKNLRQWKGGPVKIDPLALVQAIERYLIMRGYGRVRLDADDEISDEENSDDDIDDTMAAVSISQGTLKHRLEFMIGSKPLPYNMTIYQAVKQFSGSADGSETDTDSEHPYGNAGIWVKKHTIWYRPVADSESSSYSHHSHKRTRSTDKSNRAFYKSKKEDHCINMQSLTSVLRPYLCPDLPATVTVKDPALQVCTLLRLIYALNMHWNTLYETNVVGPILSHQEFLSSKMTAKANRQLQDSLVIMTGNLPNWLTEITSVCPFLLPFDTRQILFYSTSFDRDRAMQRLQDGSPSEPASSADSTDRVTPRIERRKRIVSRDDMLKQAEKVLDELGSSRALLEVQYENEVGTGLGPTLEFYALSSRELQRADLDLWRGEPIPSTFSRKDIENSRSYMYSPCGLFPAPLGKHTKSAVVNKIKSKFKFLGKLMAKAIMDSRMLDIPLSIVFYKWLLGQEHTMTSSDLQYIDPTLARSYYQLEDILRQKKRIYSDKSHTTESRRLSLDNLTLDGCSIEDLSLDFVLPGYPHIELKKSGRDIAVTIDNLEEYLRLVTHWTLLEGVRRQFEALKEGFESIFPLTYLNFFYSHELEQLFCGGAAETWEMKSLLECCRPDHGYTHDSRAVNFLYEILSSYGADEQRQFLQFVTGSPRLPVGGLKSLVPPLTIVRKTLDSNENPDEYLPSVMTCVNYLKLPDYSSIQIMRKKLCLAAREGQLSFHLS